MEFSKFLACFCLLHFQELGFMDSKRNKKDPHQNKRIHSRETSKRYFHLRGQFGENTGIVEVKHIGMPGAICGDGFTDQDARFVCREILNTELVYPTRLTITNPASYGYNKSVWYKQLGCRYESASLEKCNLTKLEFEKYGKKLSLAAVCCKNNTERGVYSENRASYTTYCPHTWAAAKRICHTDYNSIRYNDSRSIPSISSSLYWTSSNIVTFKIGSLCENTSGFLNKFNMKNCSSIHKICLRKSNQYYLKQGDNCSCLDEDDVNHNITDRLCQENCTDNVTGSMCGWQVFNFSVSEEETKNSSTCIQVRFKNGERKYSVEDCGMLRQTICLKNICRSESCQNGGQCVPSKDETNFTCECPSNFIGSFCERDACNPSPCNEKHEICKVNEDRTSHLCIPNGSTEKYSTKQHFSEKDEQSKIIIVIAVTLAVLALAISSFVAVFIIRRKIRTRKGEPVRPNSMANKTYGVHTCIEQEVYDMIDDSRLDPRTRTPLSRRKPVEVIALDDYSTPFDALEFEQVSEYAETYDEAKLIKYQREQSKIEHSLKKVEINTRNESAYFILEKEDSVSNHDGENLNNKVDGPGNELKRVSSYEDTDNCIQLSKDKTTMDDTEYEVTSATHKIQNKSYPAYPYRSNIFEKGLDYIPESVQRKLGIRFVSGDYSEYYAYKLLRRRSAELCRCENKDLCETSYRSFENLLPKSNSDADISEENKVVSNDSVNEYDKLRYFARNETKQSNRYDRVLGNFVKGGTLDNQSVSGTARYQKRSNSV